MGTPAILIKRVEVGEVYKGVPAEGVFYLSNSINYDGYPDHTGVTLRDHYTNPSNIRELFELGNMSSIGDTLSTCEFYARDRGEDPEDVQSIVHKDVPIESVVQETAKIYGWTYIYLYDTVVPGEWVMYKNGKYQTIDEAVGTELSEEED